LLLKNTKKYNLPERRQGQCYRATWNNNHKCCIQPSPPYSCGDVLLAHRDAWMLSLHANFTIV